MTISTTEASTDLAPMLVGNTDPTGGRLIAWAESLGAAHRLASALCTTSFVPKHFAGKPAEAAAALMLGDELGFSPVSALRSIFVIGGTPGLYARSMVALVQSHGHEVWTETDTPTKVTVCGRRGGSSQVERSEWTIDRARRAGYTSNKKYESDPQAMLYARAASDVCRRIAADVLSGVPYTVEEMELEAATRPARTVKRAEPKPAPAEPDLEPVNESPLLDTSSPLAKAMFAALHEAGITDDYRLEFCSQTIGRQITTSKELTDADARRILDALKDAPVDAVVIEEPEL